MNILEAIEDEKLFRLFLGKDLSSWRPWAVALRSLYGLSVKRGAAADLLRQCTGRELDELPPEGFRTALFLTGRRSGKSRTAAVIAGFEALFGNHESKLSPGEIGLVAVVSPTRFQSGICWNYLRALFDSSPLLQAEIIDTKDSAKQISLRNGLQVAVLTGDPKKVRGFTLVAAIIDETAFFGLDEESSVRSDVELIRSIRPSLATTKGRLICISSPYARRGFCYTTWQRFHGENRGKTSNFSPRWTTLIWKAPSKTMNPTLSQEVIDDAVAEDPAAARSEYFGEFRDDVSEFVPRSLIESLVARGRKGLIARPNHHNYSAFVDLSGGRNDDATMAVAHREDRKIILDYLRAWRAPFNPYEVIREMADELKKVWGLTRVTGDNFSAEFTASAFQGCGIRYLRSEHPKAQLYRELMPTLCSGEIELLDDERMISQLAGLERRTRSGGQDIIDHSPGAHDDLANAVAGVAVCVGRRVRRAGGVPVGPLRRFDPARMAHQFFRG